MVWLYRSLGRRKYFTRSNDCYLLSRRLEKVVGVGGGAAPCGDSPANTGKISTCRPILSLYFLSGNIHLSVCLPRREERRRRGADVGGVRRSASPELPPASGRGEHGAARPRIFAAQHSLVCARTPFSRGLASEKTERAVIPRFIKRRALGLIFNFFKSTSWEICTITNTLLYCLKCVSIGWENLPSLL